MLFDSSSNGPRGLLGWSRIGAQAVRARGRVPALAAVSGPAVGLVVVDRSLFGLLACQKFYGGIGDNDPALRGFFLFQPAYEDAVLARGSY